MSDTDHEDEFDEAFKGFGEDNPTPPVTPPADDPANPTAPAPATEPPKVEEPKKDEQPAAPEVPKTEEGTPPAADAPKTEEGVKPPETPTAPVAQEEPKPLTEDGIRSIISDIRTEERNSGQALDTTTNEVLEAYYPEGLSNVLVDEKTGRELKTPQDVVEVTNGAMDLEKAQQWLMNEQYTLDQNIAKIKNDARNIAETTINFKRDSITALQKYEPLFKWQPSLQAKVWDKLKAQVRADEQKGVIISSPDVLDHYDFYLEPYQKAFEYSQGQPATNPTAPAETPPPATPGAEDRLDEHGDGGTSAVNDPNDFAQQVSKELSKGI